MSGPQGWPIRGNEERYSRFISLNRWLAWYYLDQGLGFGPPWHVDEIHIQPTWLDASIMSENRCLSQAWHIHQQHAGMQVIREPASNILAKLQSLEHWVD